MFACNRHGSPVLDPTRPDSTVLQLPPLYLDLMFGELAPDEQAEAVEPETEELAV